MSTLASRNRPWPVYAVPAVVLLAAIGMVLAASEHALIGKSAMIDAVVGTSFLAALAGSIGALILANTRRNVLWILGVAVGTTVLLALVAMVLSEMAAG